MTILKTLRGNVLSNVARAISQGVGLKGSKETYSSLGPLGNTVAAFGGGHGGGAGLGSAGMRGGSFKLRRRRVGDCLRS